MGKTQNLPTVSPKLERIAELAKGDSTLQFISIAHLLNMELLRESFRLLRKNAASGVSGTTAYEYARKLEENLEDLYDRLRTLRYIAPPVKRVWIDKEKGKKRPLGIPEIEDKIVQKAVTILLAPIYDHGFYEFSHGFISGHSPHLAIKEVREQIYAQHINWIIDADIEGFFNNIDHKILREFIQKRIKDGGIIRLIGKWLKAGVVENKELSYPKKGTPQGGVISPLLANIFLHYMLDEWFVEMIQPCLKGRCFINRFADDFIIGFELEEDARRVMAVLPKRFNRFGLNIHPEKTKLVDFRKPSYSSTETKGAGTFDYLGFTHFWGKSRKGYWIVKRKTSGKKLRMKITDVWKWCRYNRHISVKEQQATLNQKLLGHYQYYGIRNNYKLLEVYYEAVLKAWKCWLGRRSRDGYISYEKFEIFLKHHPLAKPRIVHLF
ncbi:MAG: group II intron reverse transcriptase/maturase [Euryarchaeota archaeon]|nr:group II intron reverse transcriptase/maturase [Euryarchaeota archaeon]